MWLAVLMLAAMASGSICPDNCQCRSPRVECRGYAPYIVDLDKLSAEFTELAIRDVADTKELKRLKIKNSSFVKGLDVLEITNVKLLSYLDTMPNVRVLNLSHNYFDDIPYYRYNGSSQLRVLDMGHNRIKYIGSNRFMKHEYITLLNMVNNIIDEIHSTSFMKLKFLEYLDLSNNNLHTLERILNPLISLKQLFLANNKLEHIGSTWFQNLTKLVELDISRNKLVLIPPDALKPLTSLSIFHIENNPLKEKNFSLSLKPKKQIIINTLKLEFPKDLITLAPVSSQDLTTLALTTTTNPGNECPQYCQCRSPRVECDGHVPESTQMLDKLAENFTELVIRNIEYVNRLSALGCKNSSFLKGLLLLEVTNVQNLHSYIYLQWFYPRPNISSSNILPNVLSLNLSHNSLPRVPSETFDYEKSNRLRIMDLGHNKIEELNILEILELPNLTWLNLANNKIHHISRAAFHELKSLEYLNLSNNVLYTIEGSLNPLVSLQRLFLAGNKLEHIGSTWFQNLTKLVELDISRNKLTFILADPLQPLVSLSVLKLAENPLIKRDLSLLLSTGKRLEIVDASRIGLIRVPAALTHSIRILKLAGNQLTSINSGDLDSYPLLRELDLSDNRLVGIEEDALGRLDNLEDLNLSGNILSTIPKSLPNGLKILDLSQNALTNLKVNDLQNLHLLTELKLNGNVITEIEAGFFRQLTSLKILDISDNLFLKLPSDTLNGPSNLLVLRMSGLTSLKVEEDQNHDTAFPFLTPENLVKLDVSRSPALAAQLLADNAALSACKSLQDLNLAYTFISSIRSDLAFVLPQLQKLNLLGNYWNCSEDQLWLGEWIRQHNESIEFSARCKNPSQHEGKLLHKLISIVSIEKIKMLSSTIASVSITSIMADNVTLNTDIPKGANKLSAKSTTTYTTKTQFNVKIKNPQNENEKKVNATQVPESIKRKSRNLNATNNKKKSINLSTVAYAKKESSIENIMESTTPLIERTTQTNSMENNPYKHLNTTEAPFKLSTVGEDSNKKKVENVYITASLTRDIEKTTNNVPASSTADRIKTTDELPSSTTTEKVLLAKLKQTTSSKFEKRTISPKFKEIKEDTSSVHNEEVKNMKEKEGDQSKLNDQVFSEFSNSKLLFTNEETYANEEPNRSVAEELRNSQASESGARTSESLVSGAHPGMLVLLGAATVAAAALTVVLSRRASVNRKDRLYQRHENIEVHALTPTTELW